MSHLFRASFLLTAFLLIQTAQVPVDAGDDKKQILISPEFRETDLADALHYLKEVSGMNFAVDNGVKGSVTLTLKTPVHWENVLDVILKMNKLGKEYYGENTIHIFTLK